MDDQTSISGLIAHAGEVALNDSLLRRLDEAKCEYVQLASWTANDDPSTGSHDAANAPVSGGGGGSLDPSAQTAHPIYYGFNGRLFAQLFPGEMTGLIPVSNLNQICAKTGNSDELILRYVYYTRP